MVCDMEHALLHVIVTHSFKIFRMRSRSSEMRMKVRLFPNSLSSFVNSLYRGKWVVYLFQGLREANEELQATLLTNGLEEGRRLLSQSGLETSLASEFQEMTNDEVNHVSLYLLSPHPLLPLFLSHFFFLLILHDLPYFLQVYEALKDQQEVNSRLRAYIDGILLNIVENHPQLLEVKNKKWRWINVIPCQCHPTLWYLKRTAILPVQSTVPILCSYLRFFIGIVSIWIKLFFWMFTFLSFIFWD